MDTVRSDEGLRVWMINYLSEKLGEHAILKGGMVLRLLDCPRYTNDLDYVFIPFRSKKEIVPLVRDALQSLKGITVACRLHSTNAQFNVVLDNPFGTFKTQIEANTAESCESIPLSTGDFALTHHQLPHVVRVMRFDVALAHKLAAWNERRLMRDLYDIYFIYKNLNELPDIAVLKNRLSHIVYAKRTKAHHLPKRMSVEVFLQTLEEVVTTLTSQVIEEELRDYMDLEQLVGLDHKMKVHIHRMIEAIRQRFHPA